MPLCGLWLRGNRSPLSEKSIWAVIMGLFKRQDIQAVNIKAEQLAGLSNII
jgi:ribulose kinase